MFVYDLPGVVAIVPDGPDAAYVYADGKGLRRLDATGDVWAAFNDPRPFAAVDRCGWTTHGPYFRGRTRVPPTRYTATEVRFYSAGALMGGRNWLNLSVGLPTAVDHRGYRYVETGPLHLECDVDGGVYSCDLPEELRTYTGAVAVPCPDGAILCAAPAATRDAHDQFILTARFDPSDRVWDDPMWVPVGWDHPRERRYGRHYSDAPVRDVRWRATANGLLAYSRMDVCLIPYAPDADPVHHRIGAEHTLLDADPTTALVTCLGSPKVGVRRGGERKWFDLGRPVETAATAPDGLSFWVASDRQVVRVDLD